MSYEKMQAFENVENIYIDSVFVSKICALDGAFELMCAKILIIIRFLSYAENMSFLSKK